jgi:hypothetical protein
LNREPALLLGHQLDAIIAAGDLLFRNEYTVRHFLDMAIYFQEATDVSINTFFSQDTFSVNDMQALKDAANQVLRRKLQRVIDSGRVPTPKAMQIAAAKHLGLKLTIRRGALVVPTSSDEFATFVRLLNHDYVQSVTDESARFVTSSKRPLPDIT